LEGAHQIKSGKLVSFSEQELVDCDNLSGGCNGGNQSTAFRYWKTHYAETESTYPYTARNGSCKYSKSKATDVEVPAYTNVKKDDPSALKAAVNKTPISISIEADKAVFQNYHSGVMDSTSCGTRLDHAVLVAGYGTESGQDYWLVKNSWGSSWGENGYIKLAIVDGKGICGCQMGPLYPTSNE